MRERYEHFIGGASVRPRAGRYLETRNPATGKRLAEIARGDEADVDAAVLATHTAFDLDAAEVEAEIGRAHV